MARKRFMPEQVISKSREAGILLTGSDGRLDPALQCPDLVLLICSACSFRPTRGGQGGGKTGSKSNFLLSRRRWRIDPYSPDCMLAMPRLSKLTATRIQSGTRLCIRTKTVTSGGIWLRRYTYSPRGTDMQIKDARKWRPGNGPMSWLMIPAAEANKIPKSHHCAFSFSPESASATCSNARKFSAEVGFPSYWAFAS